MDSNSRKFSAVYYDVEGNKPVDIPFCRFQWIAHSAIRTSKAGTSAKMAITKWN